MINGEQINGGNEPPLAITIDRQDHLSHLDHLEFNKGITPPSSPASRISTKTLLKLGERGGVDVSFL